MSILKYKYKAHKLINTLFYVVLFVMGFILGYGIQKISFNKLISQVLMIENVQAYTIATKPDGTEINEEYIYNFFNSNVENFDITEFGYIWCNLGSGSSPLLSCYATNKEVIDSLTYRNQVAQSTSYNINITEPIIYEMRTITSSSDYPSYYLRTDMTRATFYRDYNGQNSWSTSNIVLDKLETNYLLDFSDYLVEPVELDAQVNTWNGYGYDYYTNQIGILDMREDTYIISSHTCPNDGDFVSGYLGDTNDICFWSYYSDLSDYLVFYFNGRNYDSENVEWSNITFLQGNTYVLSFTLYGLVDSETLSSIQFSLEGELTQEIFSSNFTEILRESMDEKTYITFAITPTEDIEMDHFFLKFNSNGSYAQTVGANRLWSYKDYTGRIDEIELEQTDKSLMTNGELKDLINDPLGNSESVDDFWDEFNHRDFGLTQIITAPINTIKKISNGTCTPIDIEMLGKTIELPCGDDIFWNREDVSEFKIFWNMFWGGILCYGIGRLIVKDVQKATNPNSDKLEVIDL